MNTAQDISKQILSEIELDKVITFANDKIMFEAVKKYVLAVASKHGTFSPGEPFVENRNFALSIAWSACDGTGQKRTDEELGQDLRAMTKAVQLVGSGFKEIGEMSKVEITNEDSVNPAE